MLIKIDDSLVEYIDLNKSKPDLISLELQSLANLTLAYRDGKHILIGSLVALEYLKNLNLLEESSRRIFSFLYTRFSFLASYEEIFTEHIIVKSRDYGFQRIIDDTNQIFEVPITTFINFESVNKSVLICEDISDFEFYSGLAEKYFTEVFKNQNIKLEFELANGGGDNTWKLFKYHSDNKKICIAIADSDKDHPNGKVGGTLGKLKKEFSNHKNISISDLIELKVREKENLIPPSLYLICSNNSIKERLKKLALLETIPSHQEKLLFIDYKEGLKVGKYKNDPVLREYFENLFSEMHDLTACSIDEIDQLSDESYIIEGLGTNIINYFYNGVIKNGLEKELEKN